MADLSTPLVTKGPMGHSIDLTIDDLIAAVPGWASRSHLVVDGSAPGSYVADGGREKPFKTLSAALSAAVSGTAILVMPSVYSENIAMPDLDGLAIIGLSEVNTILVNATPGHTFSWVPGAVSGAAVRKFFMTGIRFENTATASGYKAVNVDANAVQYPNVFCDDEFDIHIVDAEGNGVAGQPAVFFRNVGRAYWTHGDIEGGDLYVTNCSEFVTREVQVGTLDAPMNVQAEYDGNNPRNLRGRSNITLAQDTIVYGDVQILGHPIVILDRNSTIAGNVTGVLTSFYASGRDYCPQIVMRGDLGLGASGGAVTLAFPDPQASGAAFSAVDWSEAHIIGAVTLSKANFSPANSRGYAVVSGKAQFHSTINVSGYVALDLHGADYNPSQLTVGAGAIVTVDSQDGVTLTASRAARTDDSGLILKCNHASTPIVIAVNADAAVGWSSYETLAVYQAGAAASSFSAGSGVTFRNSAPTPAQYKLTKLMRVGANEWAYI